MDSFKLQIEEDIRRYQSEYSGLSPYLKKPEYAFHFWILDNIFCVDENCISEHIVEYNDGGIDAFVIQEDSHDIYLIQDKYYGDETMLTPAVVGDFLNRPLNLLNDNVYTRNSVLQNYFTKNKNHSEFRVHLCLYVTNNRKSETLLRDVKRWNTLHSRYEAHVYYLDDIKELFFGEKPMMRKTWMGTIVSVNKSTILNVNTEDYSLLNLIDARYVFTPVSCLYNMYVQAAKDGYPLFDENIRDYLGNTGLNKAIYETLLDEKERLNFFYYNNGITIVCDDMGKRETFPRSKEYPNMHARFTVKNPQIVNGCQTVNSIFMALDNVPEEKLSSWFADTFVMVKVLQIDTKDAIGQELYKKIVKYNNSQNAVKEELFVRNTDMFISLQKKLQSYGFILEVKQSDKYQYRQRYKNNNSEMNKLLYKAHPYGELFGLSLDFDDLFIDIKKLLQVIGAFHLGGFFAFTKKPDFVKPNTDRYKAVVAFIDTGSTVQGLLYLWLLYKRLEYEKKKRNDATLVKGPVPYYALDLFGKEWCYNRDGHQIVESLSTKEKINDFVKTITVITSRYIKRSMKSNSEKTVSYNDIIKQKVDYALFSEILTEYNDEQDY